MARVVRRSGSTSPAQLRRVLASLRRRELQVGWFESARYDEGTPVAAVAAIQEFGSPSNGIPPRPFMRPTIADNKDDWRDVLETGLRRAVNGQGDGRTVLELLGLRIAGQIRSTLSQIREPPLSPVTLALRKQKLAGATINRTRVRATAAAIAEGETGPGQLGDSAGINPKPLVFTGILLGTVTHVVE